MTTPTILETPCREWQGPRLPAGYGMLRREGRKWYVHRWVWTLMHGPIPKRMQVLHRCDNPPCFRLDHLFLGTQRDNMHDKSAKGRHENQAKTHCPKGHEYTPENTYMETKGNGRLARKCRLCRNAGSLRWYHAKKQAHP